MKFKFVVQAWSNTAGWQTTKYGGDTLEQAKFEAQKVLSNASLWVGNKATKVRAIANPYLNEK